MKYSLLISMALLTVAAQCAKSTELDHRFINPAFGGNPLNGTFLLNDAQAQNTFKPPTASTTATSTAASKAATTQSTLDSFKTNLERTVLSRLSMQIVNQIFPFDGSGNGTVKTGTYDVGDYVVTVSNVSGGLSVQINDIISGASTTVTVPTTATTTGQ